MQKIWQVQNKEKKGNIVDILLENRGLKTKSEKNKFLDPVKPEEYTLQSLNISKSEVGKAIKRINYAKKNKESVFIYGDYDADGVTATAVLWEALYKAGINILPYIPDRFTEGYGINFKSVEKLKIENPNLKLIITVDNGITANKEIGKIRKLGIDVIVTDHHALGRTLPKASAIIHTTQISGSGVAYILAREYDGKTMGLELVAIGTIADQLPLIGANRSFAKYGLKELNKTKRVGLIALLEEAGIQFRQNPDGITAYEINYMIAPRINSMGRLKHGIDALRLLCVKDGIKARRLARLVGETNIERQKTVDEVIGHVRKRAKEFSEGIIILAHKDYHEGVIGLAAGKLVEEFWRPAIVISKGEKYSKGSARSIPGFNIIEEIRKHEDMLVTGGGHPMAAGFTIETTKLEKFSKKLNKTAKPGLTAEVLARKLKIDCELDFESINWELVNEIKDFKPNGIGNPEPTFLTREVEVDGVRFLGKEQKHLKLKLKAGKKYIDAIGFGLAENFKNIRKGQLVDVVFSVEENIWNGTKSLQLRIRDLRLI